MPTTTTGPIARRAAVVLAAALLVASCGSDGDEATESTTANATTQTEPAATAPPTIDPPATDPPATDPATTNPPATDPPADDPGDDGIRSVPEEYETIQAAVDAASEGEIVLIAPGTYVEAVDVTTENVTIRGFDRDTVVLDGEFELDNGIRVLGAGGVAVENLTTVNYTNNGVFWVSSEGYRASYITTYRTGDYGIYAFDSVKGQIEYSHTIGSRDAGIYIGQCYPCDAVVTDVIASHNGLGYSGTNSGGNLLIVNSTWHNNRVGLSPNSGSYELCYPQRETTIVGNLVYDNNQSDVASIDAGVIAQRTGITVSGGIGNVIARNRVDNHQRFGIGLIPFLEEEANDDQPPEDEWALTCEEQKQLPVTVPEEALLWNSYDNVVRDNVVTNSGEADIVAASADEDVSTFRNCFAGNEITTAAPTHLMELAPCDGEPGDDDWAEGDYGIIRWLSELETLPGDVPWQDMPLPELGAHENMTDPAGSPARPATDVPFPVDLDAITVPELPGG